MNDEEKVVEADEETDTIIYYFENARIVVPNTGV